MCHSTARPCERCGRRGRCGRSSHDKQRPAHAPCCVMFITIILAVFETGLQPSLLRPTPASFCIVFLSGIRKRKNVFQVTQYKTCQILVQTFPEPWVWGSPSVFHFRNRKRFQVPGFEWVHELWLFCLASNPAQFCAEISCGKTGLGHIFKLSDSRKKNDFSVCRRGALSLH